MVKCGITMGAAGVGGGGGGGGGGFAPNYIVKKTLKRNHCRLLIIVVSYH